MLIETKKEQDCLYYFLKTTNIFILERIFKKWTLPELTKKINQQMQDETFTNNKSSIKRFLNKLIQSEILVHNGYETNSKPIRLFEIKKGKLKTEWKKCHGFKISKELDMSLS